MITYDANIGWNSGGRSRLAISGDLVASFTIDRPVGVVVGLNESDLSADYREINHAIMFKRDSNLLFYQVLENGVSKTAWATFSAMDKFSIMRVGGVVSYWRNSDKIYTSLTPSPFGVFLDTSLFSAGDSVI